MWHKRKMVVPVVSSAPPAHADMPKDVATDYNEARVVLNQSPRSAAALLRLALQKLCTALGEDGKNINSDIKALVAKGLPVEVQRALDIIRVVGNEQVHPGKLDVRDEPLVAAELFRLINFIVEDRITRPRKIAELYNLLPEEKLEGIRVRDKGIPGVE